MSATAIVAVTGAISTPLVAIAGYVFNARRAAQDPVATRALAQETHAHERILAEAQREHEERLRRGERQYEDKKKTYLDLLRASLVSFQIVHLTEPLVTYEGMPEMPEQLSPEAWRDLMARLEGLGSGAVVEGADAFDKAVRAFISAVTGYRLTRDSADPSSDLEGATKTMLDRREAVGKAFGELRRLVRGDLANL